MYARRMQRTVLQALVVVWWIARKGDGGVADRETGRAVSTGTTETVAVGGGSESVGVARGGMGEAGVGRARLHLINLNPN